jgi:tetratricopeptide (TPR) repeat protein
MRPTWIAAFLLKAEALSRSGAPDQAIAALEAARAKKLDTDRVLLALADLHERAATEPALASATALYQQVIARNPTEPRAPYGLAWVLERQKKYEEAEKQYRAAALLLPQDAAVVDSVGFCLLRQGRITDAQTQFRKAIDIDPKFPSSYANLGATYDAQANYTEAVRWYDKLLHLKGQENNLRALVNLAFDHEALGSFPKAEEYLKKARKIKPDDSLIVTWLGDNLYFQEKWKDAEKAYGDAITLDAKQFYAHRGLGFTLGKLKKWADAVAALEKAKELKANDLDVLVALGDIYLIEMEDLEKALKAYEAYVQAGGADPLVTETINEIRKELEERKK